MEMFLDCLPCMLRQALEAARMASPDPDVQAAIMDDAMAALTQHRTYGCPPEMAATIHGIVKERSGLTDPYEQVKTRDVAAALRLEPMLREFASDGSDALLRALKVSATGNVMDAAIFADLDIEACVSAELAQPFAVCDLDPFVAELALARTVLIIGDNAGEAVFDKVLAGELARRHPVLFAVREQPIINDVTAREAQVVGIAAHATVVSTGCGAPGAILAQCSPEFRRLFEEADVVISKGQGNFEALSGADRRIYFLLKAKCPRLASALGVEVGEYVFRLNALLA